MNNNRDKFNQWPAQKDPVFVDHMFSPGFRPGHKAGSDLFKMLTSALNGNGTMEAKRNGYKPKVNVTQDEKATHLFLDLPGVSKEDISVKHNDGMLTVSAKRSYKHEQERDGYHRVESFFGEFSRSFDISEGYNIDEITSEFKDGVLQINLPKVVKQVVDNSKTIEVK